MLLENNLKSQIYICVYVIINIILNNVYKLKTSFFIRTANFVNDTEIVKSLYL